MKYEEVTKPQTLAKKIIEGSGNRIIAKTGASDKAKEDFKSQFNNKPTKPANWEQDVSLRNKHSIETKKEKI